jgi:cobalt/nickel transport protein
MKRRDIIMLLIVVALVVVPLVIVKAPADGEIFLGADDKASTLVGTISPGYQPWFEPIWTPPSGEIASLLFALQAGIGSGFIGYYIGVSVGRRRAERNADA